MEKCKPFNRLLSLILCLCMVLSLLPVMPLTASALSSVTSNEGDFYKISSAQDLMDFAAKVNGGETTANALLTANIDMSGKSWTPIGADATKPFAGNFDGNGYTISNLNITTISSSKRDDLTQSYAGMIGYMKGGGVQNLTLNGKLDVTYKAELSNTYIGLLVGHMQDSIIYNCKTQGSVKANVISVATALEDLCNTVLGGMLGLGQHSIMINCGNEASVTIIGEYLLAAGGLAGYVSAGYDYPLCVLNSYNTGSVNVNASYAGGLVGYLADDAVNNYCSLSSISNSAAEGISGLLFGQVSNAIRVNENDDSTTGFTPVIKYNYYISGGTAIGGVPETMDTTGYCTPISSGNLTGSLANTLNGNLSTVKEIIAGHLGYLKESQWSDLVAKLNGDDVRAMCWFTVGGKPVPGCSYDSKGFCTNCGAYKRPSLSGDVYQISNAGELFWFAQYVNRGNYSADAKLTADLDMSGRNWTPIASTAIYHSKTSYSNSGYTGTFDGDDHTISNLTVQAVSGDPDGTYGLFGTLSGTVKDLQIKNFSFTGAGMDTRVGSVVGQMLDGAVVENCFANAGSINTKVNTTSGVAGGIAGCNYAGTIRGCFQYNYSINAGRAGGIAGDNRGDIDAKDRIGTIVNCVTNYGSIENKDRPGNVTNALSGMDDPRLASGEAVWVLNGNSASGAWGQTLGTDAYPVLNGKTVYQEVNCKTGTVKFSNTNTPLEHNYVNGRCTGCGVYEPAAGSGTEIDPYKISNAGQLYWFAQQVSDGNGSAWAELTTDIEVNTGNVSGCGGKKAAGWWDWSPIGYNASGSTTYSGTFDGKGYTISGLYINTSISNVGLFASTAKGSTVKNVGIINSYISCNNAMREYIGAVVGYNAGAVINCYNTGTVGTDGMTVGGVVGRNAGSVTACYNTGSVSGNGEVGGLVGLNNGSLTNCYNSGLVYSSFGLGAVAGYNEKGTIISCYYDNTVLNMSATDGNTEGTITNVIGKTTKQFASGEVAYLLGAPFGQDLDNGKTVQNYPTFTGAAVYQVKNCINQTLYSNANENVDHILIEGTYTDNRDGTHSRFCAVCGLAIAEAHSYTDMVCLCGALSPDAAVSVTIGGNVSYYATLDAAIQAVENTTAADNAVVTLLKNIALGTTRQSIYGGVFTIDLNGCEISSTVVANGVLFVSGDNTNVTIADTIGTGKITSEYGAVFVFGGTATINGGSFYGTDCALYALYGTVTINGGSFYGGIQSDESSVKLTQGENGVGATFHGGITVSLATLNEILGKGAAYWQGSKMIISADDAVEITGGDVVIKAVCKHTGENIYTNSGDNHSFDCTNCGNTITEAHSYTNQFCACGAVSSNAAVVVTKNGVVTGAYTTLDAAIQAVKNCTAEDHAVVKLLKNIDLDTDGQSITGGVFTLDLNGCELSSWTENSYGESRALSVSSGAIVTISDSGQNGYLGSRNYGILVENSTLTVAGGSIDGTNNTAIQAFNSTVTIRGGDITGDCGVYAEGNSEITISGGTYYGWTAVYLRGNSSATISDCTIGVGSKGVYVTENSTLTITGGDIMGDSYGVSANNSHVTINGGKIQGNIDIMQNSGTVILNGGTFPGGITVEGTTLNGILGEDAAYWQGSKMILPADDAIEITDGDVMINSVCKHGSDIASYVNNGSDHTYTCSGCGTDGTEAHRYTDLVCVCGAVSSDVPVTVTIGGQVSNYSTLDAAFQAVAQCTAADKAVVKLLKNFDLGEDGLSIGIGVCTLDLNGYEISCTDSNSAALSICNSGTVVTIIDTVGTGKITGNYGALEIYDTKATICGGSFFGKTAVDVSYSTVTISGGSFVGRIASYYGTTKLTLGENAEGATFPGGISVEYTYLSSILGEGAAYWQDGKMISLADGATQITGGDVVVKAACKHEGPWTEATCTAPKTCSVCGTTEGDLGHIWKTGACDDPKTCTICGITEGVIGHTWKAATCTAPMTCTVCGTTEGEALGHSWKAAACTTPKTCTVCGTTEGEALGHSWKAATCTAPKTCIVCNETEGEALGHSYDSEGFCVNCATGYEPAECGEDGWYILRKASNLFWFAQQVNNGSTSICAILAADIDLEEREWTPIGSSVTFGGIIDGRGHSISGMKITAGADHVGFIGHVSNGGVKDLSLSGNIQVNDALYCGMFIGRSVDSVLYNCTAHGNITVTAYTANEEQYDLYGGMIGLANHSVLLNCGSHVDLSVASSASYAYFGGMVGWLTVENSAPGACLLNSYCTGDVLVQGNSSLNYGGGLVAYLYDDAVNNYCLGSVVIDASSTPDTGRAFGQIETDNFSGYGYGPLVTKNYMSERTSTSTGSLPEGAYEYVPEAQFQTGEMAAILNANLPLVNELVAGHKGFLSASEWKGLFKKFNGDSAYVAHWTTKDGMTIHCTGTMDGCVCTDCGYTSHDFVDGTCSACGTKDPNYIAQPTIALKYPTLTFKDEVLANIYFAVDNMDSVVEMGMITYTSQVDSWNINNAQDVISGYNYYAKDNLYIATTRGIPAKNLGDDIWFSIYAKLTDGSYVYSMLASYSPKMYADSMWGYDAKLDSLLVAMLNYGAAAQTYFGYKTDKLVNRDLTEEQNAMVSEYSSDMIAQLPSSIPAEKQGAFANNGGFNNKYPSVSFKGAFAINYYCKPAAAPVDGITLYYWDEAAYAANEVLTAENATGTVEMTQNGNGEYTASVKGIAARKVNSVVYVAFCYDDGTTDFSSGVLAYSIGEYCRYYASVDHEFTPMAKVTAVYGFYAKEYFG